MTMLRTPNKQQNDVINDLENNIILFASAGTGKTFTVANRVANILNSGKATAQEILCLTFTIKASKEMSEDILGYAGSAAKDVLVNTIHSFCYRVILEENKRARNQYTDLCVCDEVDQEEILRSILSSRYLYWAVEEKLSNMQVAIPDWENCEVCKMKEDSSLYFKIEDKLIDFDGEIYDIPKEVELTAGEAYCPVCGEITPLNGRTCSVCGHFFDFRLKSQKFDIFHKKAALRNFVSELKHCQEENGFYSENAEEDYRAAFIKLREGKAERYKNLISYSAQYIGYTPDEKFEEGMEKFVGKFLLEYDEYLKLSELVDFDDLILKANAYLCDEEILACWSTRFKYIIVDEMQDTSVLEYKVLKKLFAKNNVMLCGDFFQTIYEWRGSNPEKVLEGYIKDFSAKIYMFSENYRSTKTLAQATFGYLQNTYPQWVGKYCPESLTINSEKQGEPISCYAFSNREEEAWKIYKYLQATKGKTNNACVIARSNKYIAELYRYFEKFNNQTKEEEQLRFFTVEENFNFYKKPVIKDILAVLRLLVNQADRSSLERLTEKYVKMVGVKTIESLRGYNQIGVSILSFIHPQTHLYGDCYYHLIEGYNTDNIVIYDTETTGLDLTKDEIVQLSAIKLSRSGEILDTLDLMIEPTVEISQAAYETHGFDLQFIRENGGITALEALQRFSDFTSGCVLVGHNNLSYDKPLVERQLKENGLPPLNILAEYDTLVIAKQFYGYLENFKLDTLCKNFNVTNECAHNALGDITATGQCLIAMLQEKILPTAAERRVILSKYKDRFAKIYAFIEEMRLRLQNGEELPGHIIDRLNLKKLYPTNGDLTAMRDIMETLKPVEDMESFLKEFLKDAALSNSQMDVLIQKLNRIPIITVHQSKGCEFDTVILAGADDSNFPTHAAKQSGKEDEERKVFYVAITRAKEKLILTRAMRNGRYELNETPYFWMLPEEYIQTNYAWRTGN